MAHVAFSSSDRKRNLETTKDLNMLPDWMTGREGWTGVHACSGLGMGVVGKGASPFKSLHESR